VEYEIRIQDPTDPPRSPLLDVIVELSSAGTVIYSRWFFGFLTGSGMDALLAVNSVREMLRRCRVDVLVGLDAVTDRLGLQRLRDLAAANPDFRARVIKNTTGALVHPKMLLFEYDDGRGCSVIGSNNMSGNGLSGNVEGYSILRYGSEDTPPDLSDWDAFEVRWAPLISPIDDEAMEFARRNERNVRRAARGVREEVPPDEGAVVVSDGQVHEIPPAPEGDVHELMLVAQVPRAGGRWSQVHYSAEIMHNYFRAAGGEVVLLRKVGGATVEERAVVYSPANKNYKIELGAAHDLDYPEDGRPVVLFRREGSADSRRHQYVLLMPGDDGHAEMAVLADDEFTPHGNQLPRAIVARSSVLAAWPDCPL
jgi:hypothetical protein